jgi:adenine phosphoribosyltransferase
MLEAHIDAVNGDDRVLLIDDLLATGGTAKASCELLEKLGAKIEACAFVVELGFLEGREKLKDYEVHSLLLY